jgi:LysR family hydrogen peroxide-inducible transcriptional activator
MPTLTQFEYAVAVATHGHFGKAAVACNVSQPALSAQIQKLERELDITLFDRSRQPVLPTDLGRQVLDQARVVLREVAHLQELRDANAGVIAGELRVGVLPTLAPYLLPRFLRPLMTEHPSLRLVVEELRTSQVLQALRDDSIDIGLIATDPEATDLTHRALFREPMVVYAHARHALARQRTVHPDDLSSTDAWLLSDEHCLRAQTARLCRDRSKGASASCSSVVRFESGNVDTLRRMVEEGDGFTVLPFLAVPAVRTKRAGVIPFAAPVPTREVRLVQRRAYLKRHLIEAFVDALLASLPPECARSKIRRATSRS